MPVTRCVPQSLSGCVILYPGVIRHCNFMHRGTKTNASGEVNGRAEDQNERLRH